MGQGLSEGGWFNGTNNKESIIMNQSKMNGERTARLRIEELAYLLGMRAFSRAIRAGSRSGVKPVARKWERKFDSAIHKVRSAHPGCAGS